MVSSNITEQDIYSRLALLWSDVLWGWVDHLPPTGTVQKILKENFTAEEAQALSEIPRKPIPLDFIALDEISTKSSFPRAKLEEILDAIAKRGLLFSGKTKEGEKGYALLKMGYGFSQVFFWKGKKDSHARKLAFLDTDPLLVKAKAEMFTKIDTKVFRYIPVTEAIDPKWQNVYPTETIEKVIKEASTIALAHCPCRMKYELINGKSCGHSTDVCMKLDDLAECVIGAGLAEEITKEEASGIIQKADREGLVHFTDNTGEGIKHICNCCGCACWNLRPIRERLIPRDLLMATYFLRETIEDECTGCENCVETCPVTAVRVEHGVAKVDLDWCIGCGVCIASCPSKAIILAEKRDKPIQSKDFFELHTRVNNERASVVESRKSKL